MGLVQLKGACPGLVHDHCHSSSREAVAKQEQSPKSLYLTVSARKADEKSSEAYSLILSSCSKEQRWNARVVEMHDALSLVSINTTTKWPVSAFLSLLKWHGTR